MKKIPSVFMRNPEKMSELLAEVNPAAQWVIDGEGVATRKYDGTCVMFDGENWWARREVKEGKTEPSNWVELDFDPETGKRMGWEPIEQSGYRKQLNEALAPSIKYYGAGWFVPGTYELCGPKVGNNFEGLDHHTLFSHDQADRLELPMRGVDQTDYDYFKGFLLFVDSIYGWEGIVWHHRDGRMAKLKVRDFKRG